MVVLVMVTLDALCDLDFCRAPYFILHPSSFILHPSSFILHPSRFRPTPAKCNQCGGMWRRISETVPFQKTESVAEMTLTSVVLVMSNVPTLSFSGPFLAPFNAAPSLMPAACTE
jgi:hypothetical protein